MKNELCEDLYHAQLYAAYDDYSDEGSDEEDFTEEQDTLEKQGSAEEASKISDKSPIKKNIDGEPFEKKSGEASFLTGTSKALKDEDSENSSSEDTEEYSDAKIKVTDDPKNEGTPQHALVVKTVTVDEKALSEQDLYFTCALQHFQMKKPKEKLYLFSSAFRSGWFYISTSVGGHNDRAKLNNYLSRSPQHEPVTQEKLEEQYVTLRDTISTSVRVWLIKIKYPIQHFFRTITTIALLIT